MQTYMDNIDEQLYAEIAAAIQEADCLTEVFRQFKDRATADIVYGIYQDLQAESDD